MRPAWSHPPAMAPFCPGAVAALPILLLQDLRYAMWQSAGFEGQTRKLGVLKHESGVRAPPLQCDLKHQGLPGSWRWYCPVQRRLQSHTAPGRASGCWWTISSNPPPASYTCLEVLLTAHEKKLKNILLSTLSHSLQKSLTSFPP